MEGKIDSVRDGDSCILLVNESRGLGEDQFQRRLKIDSMVRINESDEYLFRGDNAILFASWLRIASLSFFFFFFFFFCFPNQGHIEFCSNILEIGDDPLMACSMIAVFLNRYIDHKTSFAFLYLALSSSTFGDKQETTGDSSKPSRCRCQSD